MPESKDLTVRELIQRLNACNPDAVVRLAVNPFFPFSHFLGEVVEGTEDGGGAAVFLGEAGQQGYLPLPVAQALTWLPANPVPSRRARRRAAGSEGTQ
ncbi:hypothetical protein [Streptomyces sp. YIM 98790]|uniref:hypothetical protein n=1 Tax=Streptomyces sp. YIM 98790 TaxID=2689077 RepID=UPI00140A5C51|nr:hypothetical protein [Streptomyces sp. YIM 98790]